MGEGDLPETAGYGIDPPVCGAGADALQLRRCHPCQVLDVVAAVLPVRRAHGDFFLGQAVDGKDRGIRFLLEETNTDTASVSAVISSVG